MKIIFYSVPGYGHVNPTVPIMAALKSREAKVIVYTSREFFHHYRSATNELIAYPPEMLDIYNSHAHSFKPFAKVSELTLDLVPRYIEQARRYKPDLIIHDVFAPWGKYVAHATNTPAWGFTALPNSVGSGYLSPHIYKYHLPFVFKNLTENLRALGKMWKNLGKLGTTYDYPRENLVDSITAFQDINITPSYPDLYEHSGKGEKKFYLIEPTFYSSDENAPKEYISSRKRKAYLSLGSVFNDNLPLIARLITTLEHEEFITIVAGSKNYDNLRHLESEKTIIMKYAPQEKILEVADLFITHAGFNSTNQAITLGVPMICVPQAFDQYWTAERLENLGCGKVLKQSSSGAEISKLLNYVSGSSSMKESIRQVRENSEGMHTLSELSKKILALENSN